MKTPKRSSTFRHPIVASPDVIITIRRLVQHACEHTKFKPLDPDGLRLECADCGYQMRGVAVEQFVRTAR